MELLGLTQIVLVVGVWISVTGWLAVVFGTAAHHHFAGFLLSVESHQLLTVLLVRHAKLFLDGYNTPEAIDVIAMVCLDVKVNLEGLVKQVHSSVARCNHKLPLDFLALNLSGTLEENDCLFEHVVFGVMHSEAGDHIDFGGVVSKTLVIVVDCLELVLFLLIQVAHFGENL